MSNFFKRFPLATIIAYGTTALAVLAVLQTSGTLTGKAAAWVDGAAGLLQVLLTVLAKSQVTPTIDPHDAIGRPLVPSSRPFNTPGTL